jgi:fructose-bisphosphate aldolase class 1
MLLIVPDIPLDAKKSAADNVTEKTIIKVLNFFSKMLLRMYFTIIPTATPPYS